MQALLDDDDERGPAKMARYDDDGVQEMSWRLDRLKQRLCTLPEYNPSSHFYTKLHFCNLTFVTPVFSRINFKIFGENYFSFF
jgi:hypothetical protein